MNGLIPFPQHEEPYGLIVHESYFISQLENFSGRTGFCFLHAMKTQNLLQGFPRQFEGKVELADNAGAVDFIVLCQGEVLFLQYLNAA